MVTPTRKKMWIAVVVTVVYALITIVVTYPVAFKLSSAMAGFEERDALQYTWLVWWFKTALVDMHTSPANLALLYAPCGAHHPLLMATPGISLLSVPLSLVLTPPTVYNLQFLLSFVLTALATYLLCYELSRSHLAAFVGGLIFAFSPYRMGHALAGHFTLIATWWVPLYALFLIRLLRHPSIKNSVLCGIFLALSLLIDTTYIAYLLAPLTVCLILWQRGRRPHLFLDAERIRMFGFMLLVAAVLAAPFLIPFVIEKFQGGLRYLGAEGTVNFSTDLLAFLTPSPFHPLLSKADVPVWMSRVFPDRLTMEEGLAYLGVLPLLLAIVGVVRRGKEARVWLGLGLCAALLSLGPFLKVGGRLIRLTVEGQSSYLPLPYVLLKGLPFLEWGRTPGRLNETTMFALAILVAYGVADLWDRLRGRWLPVVLIAGVAVFILVEYTVLFPFPMSHAAVPAFYYQIAGDGEDYAVLDLPILNRPASNYAMYYQTVHRRRIVGGYITRFPPGTRELTDFISSLAQPGPGQDIVPHPSSQERRAWLAQAGIGKVIVHKDLMIEAQRDSVIAFLRDLLGEPIFEDTQIMVFAGPQDEGQIAGRLFSLSSEGWYQVEQWGQSPARWLRDEGALYVWQPAESTARLRFTAYSFQQPRTVQVTVNDQAVGAVLAHADWTEYVTSDFVLQPGLNVIRFTLPAGCADFIGDPRCLARQRFAARFGRELQCDESRRAPRCLGALISGIELTSDEPAISAHSLNVSLGGKVSLLGCDLSAEPVQSGAALPVTLYWQGLSPMREDYTVFVHLTDAAGQVMAQRDGYPLGGTYPTSDWPLDVVLADRVELLIPAELPPGEYTLKAGMYLLDTLERLPAAGDVGGENAVVLGTVVVK